jgi:3,4-dihydroxy 2-butanone 4-phosphate synthase/GTP cyclohydrolase II
LPIYTNGQYTNGHISTGQISNGHSHAHGGSKAAIELQLAMLQDHAHNHHGQHGKPYITLSYAQTLDGTIGESNGSQLHISGPESLVVTHRLRAHHDAILVGIGTLLADDPQLTVRLAEGPNPQPVIVDSHLRTPLTARIWAHPKAPWIATLDTESAAAQRLRERGARLIQLPPTPDGHVDLSALFDHLGSVNMRSVMVEGGVAIIASLLRRQLAHAAVVTIAPRFLPGIRVNPPLLSTVADLQEPTYTQAGNDVVLWGEFVWSQTPSDHDRPMPSIQSNFASSSLSPAPPHPISSTI